MSLKSRLRISILALVVVLVLATSVLTLHLAVGETFRHAQERAEILAQQVKSYVLERVPERAASYSPAPGTLEQNKQLWYEIIRQDRVLSRVLGRTTSTASIVVEILIVSEDNDILAASDPSRIDAKLGDFESFSEWQRKSLWTKLWQVLRRNQQYGIAVPLGVPEQAEPIITIKVFVSSLLLRELVVPQLRQVGSVFIIALLVGILLALLVSNLVSHSLQTIGRNIERISTGDLEGVQGEDFAATELAELQAKLARLGRQYIGIRDDAENLRSNIDSMLKGLEEAVLVFDPDGRLQMAGAPAERLLSRKQEELLGQSFEQIFPSWQRLGVAIKDAARQRSSIREYPVSLNRPNLPPVRLLVNVDLVEDFRRDRASILMTLRDAESRRQLASELNVATRLAAISRLTSGVAHEIKNPLNAMALSLENAKMKLAADGNGVEAELDTISREIARLDRVLKTFVEFNQPLEPHICDCDLNQMIRQIAASVELEAQSRSVRVQFEPQVPEAPVKGDPELLKQAILNVVTNGIEAMTKAGQLWIKTYEAFDDYVLSVQDEGDGIPPEIQDKIFYLYFTTKSKAAGVGLAVTFRVVQVHNGSIAFESESGKGTCFRLRFPNGRIKRVADDTQERVT